MSNDSRWRNYLACHPHSREVIGAGVVSFEARFINALEPNRVALKLPGTYGQNRFDFVVRRADGTAVRLHPSEKHDAKPVIGKLADWRMGARAPTPGQAPASRVDFLSTIGGELLASGSTLRPIKRQRIPRTMPLLIEDADWGTSQSRLRHQLQDYSPLYPEDLSSEESSDTVEEVEE